MLGRITPKSYIHVDKNNNKRTPSKEEVASSLLTTNGFAARSSFRDACEASYREAMERHVILKTIFTNQDVTQISEAKYSNPNIDFFHFNTDIPLHIVACRITTQKSIFWGFGNSTSIQPAIEKAYQEAMIISKGFELDPNFDRKILGKPPMKHVAAYYENKRSDLYEPNVSNTQSVSKFQNFPAISDDLLMKESFYTYKLTSNNIEIFVTMIDKSKYQDLFFNSEYALINNNCIDMHSVKYLMHPIS